MSLHPVGSCLYDNVLETIGETPLVRLQRVAEGLAATVAVKLESFNPGGSTKDRVGLAMVVEAEERGWLKPGGTIVEATAGNTGVGLAMAAAVRGYRCVFVMPDKMSSEKIRLLQAYGAEVVITPTNVAPDSPDSYNGVADRLTREIPGAWRPNQFLNLSNPETHYRTTGPEIWRQTLGQVTVFVAGVGTGGTLSGVSRYLKEQNPSVTVVGADPEGSVLSGDSPRPWKVEGIGEDFVPKTLNGQAVDEWVRVGDAESFATARALARREGMLVGGSSGTAVAAALHYARRLGHDDLVVAMCPDTGRNYLSKLFDDQWLEAQGLVHRPRPADTLADLLVARGPRELIYVGPADPLASAIELIYVRGISQLPVLRDGKVVGSIQEVTLARILHDTADISNLTVADVLAKSLPQLEAGTHLDEAYRLLLSGNGGVLVTRRGEVIDIVTRIDLVRFWNQRRQPRAAAA
ncbi:MAG TPA: cystathionine beta-synthase [Pirellulales bacterium]|jgi:cystathionine beta-synthase|nr:cystathionine beta-synthase [Pirellulales bacterium]